MGVLKLSEHSYKTILRSHTGPIHQIIKRQPSGEEFATVSGDRTIRIWDLFSVQQKFEFSSNSDEPRTISYHPNENIIACGFSSGFVRVFDILSTRTICERKHHRNEVTHVEYVHLNRELGMLVFINYFVPV